jgi:hypothetical protein
MWPGPGNMQEESDVIMTSIKMNRAEWISLPATDLDVFVSYRRVSAIRRFSDVFILEILIVKKVSHCKDAGNHPGMHYTVTEKSYIIHTYLDLSVSDEPVQLVFVPLSL